MQRKLTADEKLRLEVCVVLASIAEGLALNELSRDRAVDLIETMTRKLEPR